MEAWRQGEQIEAMDAAGRKRRLRTMLMTWTKLIAGAPRAAMCRVRSLDAAGEESFCRLRTGWRSRTAHPANGWCGVESHAIYQPATRGPNGAPAHKKNHRAGILGALSVLFR
jgi:hypothetical protein